MKSWHKYLGKVNQIIVDNVVWALLLLVVVIGFLAVPSFSNPGNLLQIIYQSAPFGMMVLGMSVVMVGGNFDLSLESTYAFAPTIGALLIAQWVPGIPPIFGIFMTLLVGSMVGFVNGLIVTQLKANAFLITLTMLLVLRGLVNFLIPEGLYSLPDQFLLLGRQKLGPLPVSIVVFLFGLVSLHILNTKYPYGRKLQAVGSNKEATRLAGINCDRIQLFSFVLAGLYTAVGGLLAAGRQWSVSSGMGEGDILMVFAATVLGGVSMTGGSGSTIGVLGAILVLQTVQNIMNLIGFPPTLIQTVQGVILLAAVLFSTVTERSRS